ncbi:SCO3374 family protein [Streptomyces kanasensis]|uniref:SCO3374 family protein n=1 Tax=Streptomyces kanasensis TaxID=936756 RepID=UPI0036FFA772
MTPTVPPPRTPLDGRPVDGPRVARWYAERLGWPAVAGPPAGLLAGVRFDVLDLPAAAGLAVVRRVEGEWPVAVAGGRARILVAAGSAEELPGLLEWLEWGGVGLDLAARGVGGRMAAPAPPGWEVPGAAGWLRPPVPGREVEATLAGITGVAGFSGGSGLVRLVAVAAAECHRARLLAARARDGARAGDGGRDGAHPEGRIQGRAPGAGAPGVSGWRPRTPA